MYICSCNVFTDRDVKGFLCEKGEQRATVAQAYRHCSGGERPNCGSCLPTVRKMVHEHNATVTVGEIQKSMPAPASTSTTAKSGAKSPAISRCQKAETGPASA